MPLRALIVDFNSFFASVEQQEQPELRGRPVAVVPVMTDTTCCIAASYEAKRFGVKTGTNVGEAKKLCPGLVLQESRPRTYVEYHHRLITAVDSVLPVDKVMSIDEMLCVLRGHWRERETALRLAREIKERIARSVGTCLRSSIGIAPNSFLAKTASDMQKPDGLVVLEEHDLPGKLFPLKLRDFCGIGSSMEERLIHCGITTVQQLCLASKETLHHAWNGIEGDRMHAMLRGEDVERAETNRSTISHSHVLAPKDRNMPQAEAILHRLLQKAVARLRAIGYRAGALSVSVKFLGHQRWQDEMSFVETHDTLDFIRSFGMLWQRRPRSMPPPLAVGVVLHRLASAHNVTHLLPAFDPDRLALDEAMDRLNQCFGRNTVYFGGAQPESGHAPIAFTNIPTLEKERGEA